MPHVNTATQSSCVTLWAVRGKLIQCVLVGAIILLVSETNSATAQVSGANVAFYVTMPDVTPTPGNIISFTAGSYQLSTTPYSRDLAGVVVSSPAVAINLVGRTDSYPLLNTGTALVAVNGENGPIAPGDFITASSTPGVGMKAEQAGYVIGTALQGYEPSAPDAISQVETALDIRFTSVVNPNRSRFGQLTDQVRQGLNVSALGALEEPSTALRYLIALIVIIISFLFGFYTFGRIANNGIAAIGRNPLARRFIGAAVIVNVAITVAIVGSGLTMAVLILLL